MKTHFGGGKSTGFALIYDSNEAMKKFEPHYRLVRYGMASKIEKASRQQRTWPRNILGDRIWRGRGCILTVSQASSARTGRRSSGVRPRPRALRRRTRNKRLRGDGRRGFGSLVWAVHRGSGVAVGIIIVYIYDECSKTLALGRQDGMAFEISCQSANHQCISWTFHFSCGRVCHLRSGTLVRSCSVASMTSATRY